MNNKEIKEAKRELLFGFLFVWGCYAGYYLVMKIITL